MELMSTFDYNRARRSRECDTEPFWEYGDFSHESNDESLPLNDDINSARATLEPIAENPSAVGSGASAPVQPPPPSQDSVLYTSVNFNDMVENIQTGSYMMNRQHQHGQVHSRKRRRSFRDSSRSSGSGSSNGSHRGDDSSETPSGARRRQRRRRNGENEARDVSEKDMVKHLIENDKKKLRKAIRSKQNCFGCRYSYNDKNRVSREHLDRIENFYSESEGHMSDRAMAAGINEIYKDIRKRAVDEGIDLPEWDIDTILEHFKYHIIDIPAIINRIIRSFYFTFDTMQNSFFDLKQVTRTIQIPGSVDPTTGQPLEATFTVTEKVPNTRNIRCADAIAKTIVTFSRIGIADLAPERKRTQLKNMQPSLITPNVVRLRLE